MVCNTNIPGTINRSIGMHHKPAPNTVITAQLPELSAINSIVPNSVKSLIRHSRILFPHVEIRLPVLPFPPQPRGFRHIHAINLFHPVEIFNGLIPEYIPFRHVQLITAFFVPRKKKNASPPGEEASPILTWHSSSNYNSRRSCLLHACFLQ